MRTPLTLNALALLGGLLVFHSCAQWPSDGWLLGLAPATWLLLRGGYWQPAGWFMLGLLWPLLWINPIQLQLPADWETEDVSAQGWIASLPEPVGQRDVRFEFGSVELSRNGRTVPLTGRLQLTWYDAPPAPLQVGATDAQCP